MRHSLHSLKIGITVIVTVSYKMHWVKPLACTMIKTEHLSKPWDFSELFSFLPLFDIKIVLIWLYSSE